MPDGGYIGYTGPDPVDVTGTVGVNNLGEISVGGGGSVEVTGITVGVDVTGITDVSGTSLDTIKTNTDYINPTSAQNLQDDLDTVNTSVVGVGTILQNDIGVNVSGWDSSVTGVTKVEAGDSKIPVQMYAHTGGGASTALTVDGDGNLNMAANTMPDISISSMPSVAVHAIPFPTNQLINGTVSVSGSPPNTVDDNNSTTTPLAGGATWIGTATDALNYTTFTIAVRTDQDSTDNGFVVQQSPDGTNWDDNSNFTIKAGVPRRYQFPVTHRYYRVKLTNSAGVAQSYLRIQSILHRENIIPSIHKVEAGTGVETGDRTCHLVKSVLQAKNPGGDYVNIDCTNGGNLKVSLEEVDGGAEVPINPGTQYLSTAAINLDANGSNPVTDSQVLAAQGSGVKSIIHGIQIQVTGSGGKGYWFITDGAYTSETASNVKAQGAIDTDGGVTPTHLTFPFGLDMTANTAINITTTELVGQVYVTGTVYYRAV